MQRNTFYFETPLGKEGFINDNKNGKLLYTTIYYTTL